MGSHFHNWIDYNGVAFSLKFLEHVEWGHKEGVRKKVTKKSAKSDEIREVHSGFFVIIKTYNTLTSRALVK